MSFYRDRYLKSSHWDNLRLERIVRQKGKCAVCRAEFGASLDVHHVTYRDLFNVKRTDLRALCRPCHNEVHRILKLIPKPRGCPSDQWKELRKRTCRWKRIAKKEGDWVADGKVLFGAYADSYIRAKAKFYALRKAVRLTVDPDVNKRTMPWRHDFLGWVERMPHYMSPKVFYRQWFKMEDVRYIPQPGEH